VQEDKAHAELENGVLTAETPKGENCEAKKIDVRR